MNDQTLTKIHKLNVFERIIAAELNPSEFEWTEITSKFVNPTKVSQLIHRPTSSFFKFDLSVDDGYISEYSPGFEKRTETVWKTERSGQFGTVSLWLKCLRLEIDTVDPWESVLQESEVLDASINSDSNERFSNDEVAYIKSGIAEIREYLTTVHKIDPEIIDGRLSYLEDASNRVGRKDWINLLLSVLFGIVMAAAAPPESTREIFRFVGEVLKDIFRRQPLLL